MLYLNICPNKPNWLFQIFYNKMQDKFSLLKEIVKTEFNKLGYTVLENEQDTNVVSINKNGKEMILSMQELNDSTVYMSAPIEDIVRMIDLTFEYDVVL